MEIAGLELDDISPVLAIPLAEYARETDPLLGLWHLCDATELTLRFAVALALADHSASEALPARLRAEVGGRIEQPTLGKWRGMALALCRKPPADSRVPELYPFVTEMLDPLLRGTNVRDSVMALRNRLAHGGGLARAMAAQLLAAHGPAFESVIGSLSWLSQLRMIVPAAGGQLRGSTGELSSASAEDLRAVAERTCAPTAVVALTRHGHLDLWPLVQYGRPESLGMGAMAQRAVPMIYSRRGEVRLELTPLGSTEVAVAVSSATSVEALTSLCARVEEDTPTWQVDGFERELRRDGSGLCGRAAELERLDTTANEQRTGLVWLGGSAGIGKSMLVARYCTGRVSDGVAAEERVLAYRFKAGDPRCSRESFLRFAVERIVAARGGAAPDGRTSLFSQLSGLLSATADARVQFVLDGLENIVAVDSTFVAEVVIALAPHARWICAGRADGGVDADLVAAGATSVFAEGLPGLSPGDVRAMLLAKAGPLSKRLARADRDSPGAGGEQAMNPFIDRVVVRAAGLPIYVAYVVGDILSGRLTHFGADAPLPPSLEQYHGALLRGSSIGSVQQLLTPAMCALALAREPLTVSMLRELLIARGVCSADAAGSDALDRALAGASALLVRDDRAGDEPAYTLFHASLRDYMVDAPELAVAVTTARHAFAALCADVPAAHCALTSYVFRHGIEHLLDARTDREANETRAAALVCDLGYLARRLGSGSSAAAHGIVADGAAVLERCGARYGSGQLVTWVRFLQRKAHLLARGGCAALVQAAIGAADRSPITIACEAWIAETAFEEPWFRRLDRPERPIADPCVRTFEGHQRAVTGFAIDAHRGRLLSCAADASLRLWQLDTGAQLGVLEEQRDTLSFAMVSTVPAAPCLRPLQGHVWTVWSVAFIGNNRAVAAHGDRTVKVWNIESGEVLAELTGHEGYVWSVAASSDGSRVLSAGDDGSVRLWNMEDMGCEAVLHHESWVAAAVFTPDGRGALTGGGDATIRSWDLSRGSCVQKLTGHRDYIACLAISGDGSRLVSGSGDGELASWNLMTGRREARWPGHRGGVWTAAFDPSGARVLSGGRDGLIRCWDLASVSVNKTARRTLRGHAQWVWHVGWLDERRAVSASGDRTLKLWDLDAAASAEGRPCHEGAVTALLSLSPDRAISAGADGALKLWHPAKGHSLRTVDVHDAPVRALALDPRGAVLSVGDDKRLRRTLLSDASPASCATLLDLEFEATTMAVLADGRIVLGARSGELVVIAADGQGAPTPMGRHDGGVWDIALSPDGTLLASGGADGVVRLWDAQSHAERAVLRGHSWDVQALRFSPDSRRLASACRDRAVSVWDVAAAKRLGTATRHSGIGRALAWWPDGAALISAVDGKSVSLWSATREALAASQSATDSSASTATIATWPGEASATVLTTSAAADGDAATSRGGHLLIGDVAGYLTCLQLC